jgi:5-methylcytosine-specific restriction endonuclease McrA
MEGEFMRVLALGVNYEPIGTISWQKAINLLCSDKVSAIEEYEREIKSPSISMKIPSVVVYKHSRGKRVNSVKFSRKNVFIRDEGKCQYCNAEVSVNDYTLDHIHPKTRGGTTSWENVVVSCYACNQKKGEKTLKEVGYNIKKQPKKPQVLPFINHIDNYYDLDNNIPATWKFWLAR